MTSILRLSVAVALGLAAGLVILLWWMPTIVLLRFRLAAVPAGEVRGPRRTPRSLEAGDVAEAHRVLARLAGPQNRRGRLHRR